MSIRSILFSALALTAAAWVSIAGPVLAIDEENDKFAWRGDDRHYTQGGRISLLSDEHPATDSRSMGWFDKYALLGISVEDQVTSRRYGGTVGQSMFTPEDISTPNIITNDRPYAGWLYAGFIYQRVAQLRENVDLMDAFEMDLGVVGPDAFAKEAQTKVHRLMHVDKPQGWENQLHNEPGLLIDFQRTYRYAISLDGEAAHESAWRLDVMPHGGADIGTILDELNGGLMLRVGYHIPDTIGWGTPATRKSFGVHLIGDAAGRAVARNEFLDGSLFNPNSPHVARNVMLAELHGGIMFTFKRCDFGYAYTFRTGEFAGQGGPDRFGTMTLRIYF